MVKNQETTKKAPLTEEERYSQIRHIITELYKIKTIDRKINYYPAVLKELVLESPIGKQVIKELKEKKVTQIWLLDNNFDWFEEVLGDQFPAE